MRDDDPIAPSLEDFERMAEAAFTALPAPFRARCENVLIRIEDFADDATLDSFEMESPFELTGLYHGLDLTQKSHLDLPGEPDQVFLYRLPILLEWCERGDVGLRELISHVLVHEIGHHFGLTDEEIEAIEARAD
jgi:predicted Zn-dependent protease with MMP-like domain